MDRIYSLDHNRLLAEGIQRARSVNSAPIELHRATDSVDTASEHKYTVVVESDIVRRRVVSRVLHIDQYCTSEQAQKQELTR